MAQVIYEDKWIPTMCFRCYSGCGIRVHRVNGVAVKIEGNPDTKMGGVGGICGKGAAGLQLLYDPNRLNVPLRRTNPEKGLFVDPEWKEITWDEALDEIAERLKKMMTGDPKEQLKKLLLQFSVIRCFHISFLLYPFLAFGAHLFPGGGGLHCGAGAHWSTGMSWGSWSIVPDFKYCNYVIYFGASKGYAAGHSAMITARQAAEAKSRGMKLVVFDPMGINAGAKAEEWIPIIPATDVAVTLAMCNVIVNELGMWDATFLKLKTNGPYLIGPDGRYVREEEIISPEKAAEVIKTMRAARIERKRDSMPLKGEDIGGTTKPLIWDPVEGKAKVYDDSSIKDYALEGEFELNGIKCKPAFQVLKEHLKNYTPEMASEVSTVPPETIRRIATEFAQAAQIGSTVTIDGHQLPFRPASAVIFRGGQGHQNSFHTCFAVALLNFIVGSADVPGGTLGWPARCLGYSDTGQLAYSPYSGVDGFLETENFGPRGHGPWPVQLPEMRGEPELADIFSLWHYYPVFGSSDQEDVWNKIGVKDRFEMMISYGCNSVMSVASRDITEEVLKKIPFIVVSELFNNELTEGFADIVLPDTCYLEESGWVDGMGQSFNYPFGMEDWYYHILQPVVEPKESRRPFADVLFELYDRLGLRPILNSITNNYRPFAKFIDEHKLKSDERVSYVEVGDRFLRSLFGPEHDWEWFKKQGFIRWEKKVEEAYWRYFVDCRVPIYQEFIVDIKMKLAEILKKTNLNIDLSQYTPLTSWVPCSIHCVDEEYDLYCFSYRDILHTGSWTMEQPWINEVSRSNPYTYNITMNAETAKKKGIKDGDTIEIESVAGRKVRGTVKLVKAQHPQSIAIAACSGHWAKGMPIARGQGTNFDILLELDLQNIDPVSANIETSVRVKVKKAS